jgi:hypothetical protein
MNSYQLPASRIQLLLDVLNSFASNALLGAGSWQLEASA